MGLERRTGTRSVRRVERRVSPAFAHSVGGAAVSLGRIRAKAASLPAYGGCESLVLARCTLPLRVSPVVVALFSSENADQSTLLAVLFSSSILRHRSLSPRSTDPAPLSRLHVLQISNPRVLASHRLSLQCLRLRSKIPPTVHSPGRRLHPRDPFHVFMNAKQVRSSCAESCSLPSELGSPGIAS